MYCVQLCKIPVVYKILQVRNLTIIELYNTTLMRTLTTRADVIRYLKRVSLS